VSIYYSEQEMVNAARELRTLAPGIPASGMVQYFMLPLVTTGSQSNRVGTDGDGHADVSERNLICGTGWEPVHIRGSGTDHNVAAGNFMGTDASGSVALGGGGSGVAIRLGARFNRIGTNGDGVSDTAERNIISGVTWAGVSIWDVGSDHNVVAGNFIGTDVTGTLPLGNGGNGVAINYGARFNVIGTDGHGVCV
jgi:titin